MTVTQRYIISPSSPIQSGQMWSRSMQEKTGELLESDKVWKARDREMAEMADHGVKHDS